MDRTRKRRLWGAAIVALLCILAVALWQWQALARLTIVAGLEMVGHVRVSFGRSTIGGRHAVFDGIRIRSFRGEPIADVGHLELTYDLRDLLPGGRRLFGLKSVDARSARLTIVRRPDGTYNVPLPTLQPSGGAQRPPLIVRVRLQNGSVDIIDESAGALPARRSIYLRALDADANVSTGERSSYTVRLKYGERANQLYAVDGRGVIDMPHGTIDQHWTAAHLPIAAAVNFLAGSPSLRLRSGALDGVDARYFGIANPNGSLQGHLAADAMLTGASIVMTGLSKSIDDVHGRVDVYDDGLLTRELDARFAGVPARVSGGVYGLRDPQLRLAVRGSGQIARLRSAFADAHRLPVGGPVAFTLLAEGSARRPVTWIALQSPQTTYASTPLDRVGGVVAFDGKEADVLRFDAEYGSVHLSARGRAAMQKQPNAIQMLASLAAPAGTPYLNQLLPSVPVNGVALATAEDPRAISAGGALWGRGASQSLAAIFNVDSRGTGSVGPLEARSGRGMVYARIALDRPHRRSYGLVAARDFPVAPARGVLETALFGEESARGIAGSGVARLSGSWGEMRTRGTIASANGILRGAVTGKVGDDANFAATLSGTPQSPQVLGTIVVAGGRYRNFDVNGNAALTFARGALHVGDTAVAMGPLFVGVAGTVTGIAQRGSLAPHYDLAMQLHSSDVRALVATVQPAKAPLIQGSIDADVRVRGNGATPSFAGTMRAPEGSVNGLSFRDLRTVIAGNSNAIAFTGARVVVGSSALGLSGSATTGSADVTVSAPQLDLADFNDFFDAGDMFAGTGSLALRANVAGRQILATSGAVRLADARFRRLALGTVDARWNSSGSAIATSLRFGGPTGEVAVNGSIAPAQKRVDLHATAHSVDLAIWLPMLGLNAPVTGRLNAQAAVAGAYPDLAMQLRAAVYGGTVARLPVERFDVVAAALHGRGSVDTAVLDVPWLHTVGSGTFGLHPGDSLALVLRSTSSNVGSLIDRTTGKDFHLSGTLVSTMQITGTRDLPQLRDAIELRSLQYGRLTVPRIAGEIDADRRAVALRNGEIDLDRGRALVSAALPIRLTRSGAAPGNGAMSASFAADDLDLSNFAALLPSRSQLGGRIDGTVRAGGTVASPQLTGSLQLNDGTFNGPNERSPITGITAALSFAGTRAQLQSRALVGGGAVTARAVASVADLRRPAEAGFTLDAQAENARLDLPAYFQGNLNGKIAVVRAPGTLPALSGDLSVYNARIPLNALLNQRGGAQAAPSLPKVALRGVNVAAGPNVRVQSANVDIGAAGTVRLGGTLEAPALAGAFHSTGGSLSFYRNFNLERGNVQFDPSAGVIPDVDAVATTFVPNPATAIRLHVTGPVTNMNLALASDPSYSRQQILGILVGAQQFGAVAGVAANRENASAGSAAQSLAFGQLNTVFTRNLLQPLSASLGGALGFTEMQITSDIQTGLGVNAVKAFGKNVNAIFAQSFGYPRTQSIALEAHPTEGTGLRLTAYSSVGPTLLSLQQPQPIAFGVNLNLLTAFTPITGSNGVTFSYQRKFP